MHRIVLGFACVLLAVQGSRDLHGDAQGSMSESPRRMSFHNRLLLNRAALAGLRSLEVLLLLRQPANGGNTNAVPAEIAETVERLGGRVRKTEAAVAYMRVELPPERLLELVASTLIDAYQISSLSRGSWYRDGPPVANAQMFRDYEVTPIAATEPPPGYADLPALTLAEAREPGFTADNDIGVGTWTKTHPSFDGRGVTIALLEDARPSFADAAFRTAKTLDGRDVPKIAGILNAIDPEQPDETRVRLTTRIEVDKNWTRVGNRTYVMPRPATYWTGVFTVPAGNNVVHQFVLIEDEATREIWIDANGDASFQDEQPLADVNERFDPRMLELTVPRKVDVSFVMSRSAEPHVVHIYLGTSSHQSMTASVAAGNRSDESLASGVARNARVLFVRMHGSSYNFASLAEAFIQTARRTDVDVLSASAGLDLVPDTGADFVGLLFHRLTTTYQKPIVTAPGNYGAMLGHVHGHGGALSAGGTLGPETHAAFTGGRPLSRTIVHRSSAAGPALDGAIKPDFLAPVERIAASAPWLTALEATPANAPTRRVPPGYQVSCCTSASSPYAAGVIALLVSAARQSHVRYSVETLSRALKVTARPIPGFQAHEQGNGALDVNAAWRELQRPFEPPRITASTAIVHPLAQYAARGSEGQGILEFEGWAAGTRGAREIRFRRESGPRGPVTYPLRWSADDGTFSTPPTVTLPLGETVTVPVTIDVRTPGGHSGLLTLHDGETDAVVFRTQATVAAALHLDPATGVSAITGTLGHLQQTSHYLQVPPATGAIGVELQVRRGVTRQSILQAHSLVSSYYPHVHPIDTIAVGPGAYNLLMPNPEPGTWTFRMNNDSITRAASRNLGPRDDADVEYSLTLRLLRAAIETSSRGGGMAIDVTNRGAIVAEPVLDAWPGQWRSHRAAFLPDGLPNRVDIDVPEHAQSLSLTLRGEGDTKTELYLYDCTTGECFSYDVAFPAAASHTLMVRTPTPGRWVAAVNAAPFPTARGSFVLDEVITTGTPVRRTSTSALKPGARWREIFGTLPVSPAGSGVSIVFFELLDAAAVRREVEQPWNPHPRFFKLSDRPVAIATAIHQR